MNAQKIMRIIWENETGEKWDDLYEYPYSDYDRTRILIRLEKAANDIISLMREDA